MPKAWIFTKDDPANWRALEWCEAQNVDTGTKCNLRQGSREFLGGESQSRSDKIDIMALRHFLKRWPCNVKEL
jgi:hypothetical protein